jgi:hypothetical protein
VINEHSKNFDYWITYTYLDSKRKYLNYPNALQPNFTTPHTASIAIKRFFPGINFNANLSYSIATGRPYYNIQNAESKTIVADEGKTKYVQPDEFKFCLSLPYVQELEVQRFFQASASASTMCLAQNRFMDTTTVIMACLKRRSQCPQRAVIISVYL